MIPTDVLTIEPFIRQLHDRYLGNFDLVASPSIDGGYSWIFSSTSSPHCSSLVITQRPDGTSITISWEVTATSPFKVIVIGDDGLVCAVNELKQRLGAKWGLNGFAHISFHELLALQEVKLSQSL
jgi:hypothetical protein